MARKTDSLTLVAPVVDADDLCTPFLVERCRLKEVKGQFFAITHRQRFQSSLIAELIASERRARAALKRL
jgi:hypothetical protein